MKIFLVIFLLSSFAPAQNFWTKERIAESSFYAAEVGSDVWITERYASGEENPLARPFVEGNKKMQAVGASLGFGIPLGLAYFVHRRGHPKAARWIMRLTVASETVNDVRQFGMGPFGSRSQFLNLLP